MNTTKRLSQALALLAGAGLLITAGSSPGQAPAAADQYRQLAGERGLGSNRGYGRGAAFVDIDSDGDDDLFVADTDGRFFGAPFGMSRFYLNDGSGNFAPAELQLNPDDFHGTWVGSFADYDNDGDPDMLVGNGGYTMDSTLVLLENRISLGQGFVNVTDSAGMFPETQDTAESAWWGISWADYDNDGWLDVVATRRQGRPLLFHNNGDGSFSERGVQLGIEPDDYSDAKNPLWIDYDKDGDQDLYLAGMDWQAFYRNDGDRFSDITRSVFPEPLGGHSELPVVFAAATADFDQDGNEDIYLGRWDSQDFILFGDGAGHFEKVGREAGLDTRNHRQLSSTDTQPMSQPGRVQRRQARANGTEDEIGPFENTMGLGVGDLYDDGFPDVVIGTGEPEFAAADVILCNRGERRFERCTDRFSTPDSQLGMTRGHGAVFADIDHDGYTDFYFNLGGHPNYDFARSTESRETNKLFMRETTEPANAAWLTLRGTLSNHDAIGARVSWGEGDLTRYHFIRSTMGFQSQNSRTVLIPLGESEQLPVTIDWPSGESTTLTVSTGEHLNVTELPDTEATQ